jgi:glycosyltransferase involved in cell wall biosynthesis
MLTPRVSIIIPSFNEGDWLKRTVKGCLEETNYPDFEIIVVGDGCTDGSIKTLKSLNFPNVKIINLPKSVGAVVTRNKGAQMATGEVLVFIDSHQEPITENWLKVLVRLLEKPNCGAATVNIASIGEQDRLGFLYSLKDWTLEPTWGRPKDDTSERLTSAIPGGCFAVKKEIFEQTGGFNTHLKKWGREDFEYSLRLWRLGYDLWFSDKAIMGHAFDHKRAFEISWEQVDFNTLWTARTLMNLESIVKVEATIKSLRPKIFAKVQSDLENSQVKKVSEDLKNNFKREFSDYEETFLNL